MPLDSYLFYTLKLPADEEVIWTGHNPTSHRFVDYASVLTDRALYLLRHAWWRFARWKRVPPSEIRAVSNRPVRRRSRLIVRTTRGTVSLTTQYDWYQDEIERDAQGVAESGPCDQ